MSLSIPMTRAYEEIVNFLAAGITPQSLIDFQPPEVVKERDTDLTFREKTEGLTTEEKIELDQYLLLEHLLGLAKACAHQYLTQP